MSPTWTRWYTPATQTLSAAWYSSFASAGGGSHGSTAAWGPTQEATTRALVVGSPYSHVPFSSVPDTRSLIPGVGAGRKYVDVGVGVCTWQDNTFPFPDFYGWQYNFANGALMLADLTAAYEAAAAQALATDPDLPPNISGFPAISGYEWETTLWPGGPGGAMYLGGSYTFAPVPSVPLLNIDGSTTALHAGAATITAYTWRYDTLSDTGLYHDHGTLEHTFAVTNPGGPGYDPWTYAATDADSSVPTAANGTAFAALARGRSRDFYLDSLDIATNGYSVHGVMDENHLVWFLHDSTVLFQPARIRFLVDGVAPPLRLFERDDAQGMVRSARLGGHTPVGNPPSSLQEQSAPRLVEGGNVYL